MKRILVVDDELLVRVGIKSILDWETHGYTIVGEASGGREALRKIPLCQPDILLTDLRMEDGDGLELIEECKKTHPEIQLIVLSSYNDFEDVRRAMKLGAADYLFKLSAKPSDILKCLDELPLSRGEARPDREEEQLRGLLYKNKQAVRSGLLREAVNPLFHSEGELYEEFRLLAGSVDLQKPFQLLYLGLDNHILYPPESDAMGIDLLSYAAENIVAEILQGSVPCETFSGQRGELVAFFQGAQPLKIEQIRLSFDSINRQMEQYLDVTVSAGASAESFQGLKCLPQELKRLKKRLELRFFSGKRSFWDRDLPLTPQMPQTIPQAQARLCSAVKEGRTEDAVREIRRIFHLCEESKIEPAACRSAYLGLYHAVQEVLPAEQQNPVDGNGLPFYRGIMEYDLADSIQESLIEWICQIGNYRPERSEIVRAKDYVQENLSRSISVLDVARAVNMSENYFSHIFKKETGVSFIDYVNQQRVQQAKYLLLHTDQKIYEVARQVGIDNPNYLGILFKKSTGSSPAEFRENRNRQHKS